MNDEPAAASFIVHRSSFIVRGQRPNNPTSHPVQYLAPHSGQNFGLPSASWPQPVHFFFDDSVPPHSWQNLPPWVLTPQCGQTAPETCATSRDLVQSTVRAFSCTCSRAALA